jgi:hypothetical protein
MKNAWRLSVLAGVLSLAAGGRADPPADLPFAPKSAKVWTAADPHGFAALKWVINGILGRPTYAAASNLNASALGASGAVWRAEGTAELGASGTVWRAEGTSELGSSGTVWRAEGTSELGSSGTVWRAEWQAGATNAYTNAEARLPKSWTNDTVGLSSIVIGDNGNVSSSNRWEDLRITPSGMNLPGQPAAASFEIDSGPSSDQIALRFSADGTTVAGSEWQLPHAWVSNTVVYPHFHKQNHTAGPNTSVWQFVYSWANIGGVFPASTSVTVTNVDLVGTQFRHRIVTIPAEGLSGTGKTFSSVLRWRLSRLGNDAADTGGAIDLVSSDLHYQAYGLPVPSTP